MKANKANLNMLGRGDCWKVSPAKNASTFFAGLAELIPSDSVLYIEAGGLPPDDIDAFLRGKRIDDNVVLPGGTLLPKPQIYRIPATKENLEALARLSEAHPTPVGSIHIHVYRGKAVLLQSYDAFLDPFQVSKAVPETRIKAFCSKLGLRCEQVKATVHE